MKQKPQEKPPRCKAKLKASRDRALPEKRSGKAPLKRSKRSKSKKEESNRSKIEKLETRIHELWEAEGKPEGREERLWQIAMLEAEKSPRGFFERAVGFEATMDFAEVLLSRAPLDSGFYFEAGFGGLKSASSILCPLQKVASYFNRIVFSVFERVFLGFRPLLRWLYRLQRTKQA